MVVASISILLCARKLGMNNLQKQEISNNSNKILELYKNNMKTDEELIYDCQQNDSYIFKQQHNNIEVYSGGINGKVNKDDSINIIDYTYKIPDDFNYTPTNTTTELIEIAKTQLGAENIQEKDGKLIIYPVTKNDLVLAYIFNTDNGTIIIQDSNKKVLGKTEVLNTNQGNNEINNKSVSNMMEEKLKEDGVSINTEELKQYPQKDEKILLYDKKRNIQIYKIKNEYEKVESSEFLRNDTNYYEDITVADENEANKTEYYSEIKTLQNIGKIYDYYKNNFSIYSINESNDYKLNIFTNLSYLGSTDENGKKIYNDFRNNAALFYFDDNDIRIYLGAENKDYNNIEVLAHEYTHGYFNKVVGFAVDNKSKSVNEAYSDIMGMIIEAYYGNKTLDGIYDNLKNIEGFTRNIKDSSLKYNDFNYDADYHEMSVIVSKVAYLMTTNEKVKMNIEQLSKLWLNSISKLPKYIVNYDDVERAILLTAKEQGYSEEMIKEISNIFISCDYPDIYAECNNNEIINTRKIVYSNLSVDKALELLQNNYSSWNNFKISYDYSCTVKDKKDNTYYAINSYSPENFINKGGEYLEKADNGKYYSGTYYVRTSYTDDKVFVGKNERDYKKYSEGDIVEYFLSSEMLELNTKKDEEQEELLIGENRVKFGTYKGTEGATGEILTIKNDGTVTLNNQKYKYKVEKYNFSQDPTQESYEDAIVLYNDNEEVVMSLYVWKEKLCNDLMVYEYEDINEYK